MRSIALSVILLALFFNNTYAEEILSDKEVAQPEAEVDMSPDTDSAEVTARVIKNAEFCFFAGTPQPDIQYKIIRKLKVAKGTYGGVKDILPKFADHARKVGADAVIKYTGSQRFGFFPWRTVRPVVRGVAIIWTDAEKPDCKMIGGTTLKEILDTDKPPTQ